jgi:hypothetical protein
MSDKTLLDHCSEWYGEQGITLVNLPGELQTRLYEIWINYAFAGFSGNQPNEYGIRPGKIYMKEGS